MQKTLLSFILSAVAICVMASPVSQQTTQSLATFFFHEYGGRGNLTLVDMPKYPHLHFYRGDGGKGFVIMSADDVVFPVLGYSATNPFSATDIPENAAQWFASYENQIKWHIENRHEQSSAVAEEWEKLRSMSPNRIKPMSTQSTSTFNTANLLTTTWDVSPYYNEKCPYDSTTHTHADAGNIAVAMAQIINYWEYPLRGTGSHSYDCPPYGTLSVNFADTVFNYSMMPDNLTGSSSQAEIDAVALLVYRCGVAVEEDYNYGGAFGVGYNRRRSAESALNEHFKYLHTLHSVIMSDYSDSEWIALLKNEIDNGRPMLYAGSDETDYGSMEFICCGYDNNDKLYCNWGWGGDLDGYYAIGQLDPADVDYYRFNINNRALIGIQPDTTQAESTTITLNSNIPGAATLTGAGTYSSYTDWVTIKAEANPGYLVDGWDVDNDYTVFKFLANGGNITHTARCVRITGDTLGYCHNGYVDCYGFGSDSTVQFLWGIRLDSFAISPCRQLEAVATYIYETGDYNIKIYNGTATEPTGNPLGTHSFNATSVHEWKTVTLPTPISVDRNRSLWILLEWTGQGFPMTFSLARGTKEGAWSYEDNRWQNYFDDDQYICWQIRGIFGEDTHTAVENTSLDAISAYSNGSELIIEDAVGEDVQIYDAAGRLVLTQAISNSHETIALPAGTYFIRIGEKTFKAIVSK